jgi:hypothetical protein
MDFDFFVMAQDFDIKDFKLESLSDNGNAARVKRVSSIWLGRLKSCSTFRDDQGWAIDEMTSGCETLSGVLKREEPSC